MNSKYLLNQSSKTLYYLAALCLFAASIVIFLWLGKLDLNPLLDSRVEWAILFLGILIGLLIINQARRNRKLDLFEFPAWFSLNIYIQAVFSVWIFYDDINQFFPSLRSTLNSKLLSSIILFSVSIGCIWIGHNVSLLALRKIPENSGRYRREPNLPLVIVIWVLLWIYITLSVFLNFLGWGGVLIGVWSNYLAFVQLLYLAASAVLLMYHFRNPTLFGWVWLVIALIITAINGVAIGTRGVVFYFIYIFILAYYATNRYKWSWLVLGAITLIILVPSASFFRQQFPQYQALSAQERLDTTLSSFSESLAEPIPELVDQVLNLFASRQGSVFLVTASVMQQHEKATSYVGREMLDQFLIGVIPRIFWRSKPAGLTDLYMITSRYTDASTERVFSEIGIIADTYRTGGWPLVTIIFTALGFFMGWLYSKGSLYKKDEWIVFYFLMLTVVIYSRPLLDTGLFLIQRAILVWLFVFFILFKRMPIGNSSEGPRGINVQISRSRY